MGSTNLASTPRRSERGRVGKLALGLAFAAMVAAGLPSPGLYLALGLGIAAVGCGYERFGRRDLRGAARELPAGDVRDDLAQLHHPPSALAELEVDPIDRRELGAEDRRAVDVQPLAELEQHLIAGGFGLGGGALDDLALRTDRLVELGRAALIIVLGALPLGLGLLGLAARGGDRGDPRVERVELGGDRGLVALDRALVGLQRRDLGLDPGAVHLLALDRDEQCLGLADLARDIAELVLQHGAALADGRHFLLQRLQLLCELGERLYVDRPAL